MKVGRVVYIRVNPKDCMSCIDVCQKVGTVTTGMSFAQLVSLALSSLLETVRRDGAIPTRGGFEYSQMLQPWSGGGNTKTTVQLNKAIELKGSEFIVPPLPVGQEVTDVVISRNPRIARLERQLIEEQEKQRLDPVNDRSEEILQLNQQIAAEYQKDQSGI